MKVVIWIRAELFGAWHLWRIKRIERAHKRHSRALRINAEYCRKALGLERPNPLAPEGAAHA